MKPWGHYFQILWSKSESSPNKRKELGIWLGHLWKFHVHLMTPFNPDSHLSSSCSIQNKLNRNSCHEPEVLMGYESTYQRGNWEWFEVLSSMQIFGPICPLRSCGSSPIVIPQILGEVSRSHSNKDLESKPTTVANRWSAMEVWLQMSSFDVHFAAIAVVKQDLGLRRLLTPLNGSPFDLLCGKNLSMQMHYCGLLTNQCFWYLTRTFQKWGTEFRFPNPVKHTWEERQTQGNQPKYHS